MKRRELFQSAAVCGAASTLTAALAERKPSSGQENSRMNQIPLTSSPGTRKGDMLYPTPGHTGETVSAIGMDGFHLAQPGHSEEDSIRLARSASVAQLLSKTIEN
jgi:hypothetical protein